MEKEIKEYQDQQVKLLLGIYELQCHADFEVYVKNEGHKNPIPIIDALQALRRATTRQDLQDKIIAGITNDQ